MAKTPDEAKYTHCTMPMVKCPACDRTWQWDDYYDAHNGAQLACRHCGATLELRGVEHLVEATVYVVALSSHDETCECRGCRER